MGGNEIHDNDFNSDYGDADGVGDGVMVCGGDGVMVVVMVTVMV